MNKDKTKPFKENEATTGLAFSLENNLIENIVKTTIGSGIININKYTNNTNIKSKKSMIERVDDLLTLNKATSIKEIDNKLKASITYIEGLNRDITNTNQTIKDKNISVEQSISIDWGKIFNNVNDLVKDTGDKKFVIKGIFNNLANTGKKYISNKLEEITEKYAKPLNKFKELSGWDDEEDFSFTKLATNIYNELSSAINKKLDNITNSAKLFIARVENRAEQTFDSISNLFADINEQKNQSDKEIFEIINSLAKEANKAVNQADRFTSNIKEEAENINNFFKGITDFTDKTNKFTNKFGNIFDNGFSRNLNKMANKLDNTANNVSKIPNDILDFTKQAKDFTNKSKEFTEDIIEKTTDLKSKIIKAVEDEVYKAVNKLDNKIKDAIDKFITDIQNKIDDKVKELYNDIDKKVNKLANNILKIFIKDEANIDINIKDVLENYQIVKDLI